MNGKRLKRELVLSKPGEWLDKAKKLKLRNIWQMLTVKRGERD